MVTIFRPDEMLTTIRGPSHPVLPLLITQFYCFWVYFFLLLVLDLQSYLLPEAVLFWKALRILLTGCYSHMCLVLCYLPIGI